MLYLPITRSWMFSSPAQRIYFLGALLDLALLATKIGVAAATSAAGVSVLPASTVLFLRVLFFPEVVGMATLLVGMSYFWLSFDLSGYGKKALWFVLVYLFGLLALPLYYLLVYRRQVVFGAVSSSAPTPAVV
jgi:hypothetical protein